MYADGFDYKIAAGLQRDRLAEAESIRRARNAKKGSLELAAPLEHAKRKAVRDDVKLKHRIGRQLIALGEKMIA